mmetsp:Transcript_1037/g.1847  ORF Transcript_1037/g.1847 Transcript_1037/m.1847 type:complete len:90 (-) Transcript_1037:140-409(-)
MCGDASCVKKVQHVTQDGAHPDPNCDVTRKSLPFVFSRGAPPAGKLFASLGSTPRSNFVMDGMKKEVHFVIFTRLLEMRTFYHFGCQII